MASPPETSPNPSGQANQGGTPNFARSLELSAANVSRALSNFVANVKILTGNAATEAADGPPSSSSTPTSAMAADDPALAFGNASAVILKTTSKGSNVGPRTWRPILSSSSIGLSSSTSSSSSSTASAAALQESDGTAAAHHHDPFTVSATSVFDIGSVGLPVLGRPETDLAPEVTPEVMESRSDRGAVPKTTPIPLVDLDDVRKFVGTTAIVWRKVRALGLRDSSWENKMPWRNPRPSHLARGLRWPPGEFSSDREKHEYNRRARRRGRYLIGPTPTWSWFVADLALLYFLIDNPAGKFLL